MIYYAILLLHTMNTSIGRRSHPGLPVHRPPGSPGAPREEPPRTPYHYYYYYEYYCYLN